MKTQAMRRIGAAFGLGLALAGQVSAAHAVVLENKWHAGEKLNYNLKLDGVTNVQLAPDVPFFLAGVPLEIPVKGDGRAQMETLSVDSDGIGTVALQIPRLKFDAQTFGQKASLKIENGQSSLTLNGKPLGGAGAEKLGVLSQQKAIFKIGRDGRIVSAEAAPANGDDNKAAAVTGAVGRGAAMTSLVLQTLPALWPGRDIAVGESWTATVDKPTAKTDDAKVNLGEFKMTLKGQENLNGVDVYKVGVTGNLAAPAGEDVKLGKVQFDEAKIKVDGDLWFDAAGGHIVNGALSLDSRAQGRNKATGSNGDASWADFGGTLNINLADTSAAPK